MADPVKLKVPKDKKQVLHDKLVKAGVPKEEIARLGGPGGFLSKFLGNLADGKYPGLTKLIQSLINLGISGLGSGGTKTPPS